MNLLILSSHVVLEYDDLALFSGLGYDVFMPGGYERPESPAADYRPALPDVARHPDLADLCHAQRVKHGAQGIERAIDWAKADVHPDIIDWADTIMVNCYPERWLTSQWERFKGKRVIWRTIGQSGPETERLMKPLRSQGLEIVRYSPAERRAYQGYDWFAGEDAMIRFAKDPAEWYGWTGSDPVVGNVTQSIVERAEFCGLRFWKEATAGLPTRPAGRQSELIGGVGQLTYEGLRRYYRECRVILNTGTQPASYTLSLIESMMTGCPTLSIPKSQMWAPDLFEGDEIVEMGPGTPRHSADHSRVTLQLMLAHPELARAGGELQRARAIELFGIEAIGRQWTEYLGHGKAGVQRPGPAVSTFDTPLVAAASSRAVESRA